jgi:hypothetical protein
MFESTAGGCRGFTRMIEVIPITDHNRVVSFCPRLRYPLVMKPFNHALQLRNTGFSTSSVDEEELISQFFGLCDENERLHNRLTISAHPPATGPLPGA